ncbi:MAG TPA: hypothetical protein VMV14_05110 [Acidimicrobiales bacterium]|nr:hypothetical protein [Acidimicrobiales bacterium]
MAFRSARDELLGRADLSGDDFCRALSEAADTWLAGLLDTAADGDERGMALVAVGGYGRGELCPYSDLDVVLVHRGRRDVARIADAVWYPVWDEGIRLDHSVRKPSEVLAVAAEDLRAQLGLLDGRLVAGDAAVIVPLLADALTMWRERAGLWLPVLGEQVEQRHAEHGDVAFLLEPDLKEAHGGLRDVHVVAAAARAVSALADQVDITALQGPRQVLTAARVELHRATGRATDRLLLQEQDQVAEALGYSDADALMAAIAEAGRTIAWVADDVWRRSSLWSAGRRRRGLSLLGRRWRFRRHAPSTGDSSVSEGAGRSGGTAGAADTERAGGTEDVESGVAVRGGEVVLGHDADVSGDGTLALRLAAVAARAAASSR